MAEFLIMLGMALTVTLICLWVEYLCEKSHHDPLIKNYFLKFIAPIKKAKDYIYSIFKK